MKDTCRILLLSMLIARACIAGDAAWYDTGAFQKAVMHVDRLVIRDGGMDFSASSTSHTVFAVIQDTNMIQNVVKHIQFVRGREGGACACAGNPGIDWYRGTNRVVMTAIHGGVWFQWSRSSHTATLTDKSRVWLTGWLKGHGLTEDQMQIASNQVSEATSLRSEPQR